MFLLDEHGSGSVNWKKNLVVLWTGVFLACASFTACAAGPVESLGRSGVCGHVSGGDVHGAVLGCLGGPGWPA